MHNRRPRVALRPSEITSSAPFSRKRTALGLDRHELGAVDDVALGLYGLPLISATRREGAITTPVSANRGPLGRDDGAAAAAAPPNGRIGSRTGWLLRRASARDASGGSHGGEEARRL